MMKKIISVLVVLLLAAPAMGALSITCAQGEPGECIVSYSGADNDANRPRAFALDISLSGGAVVATEPVANYDADYYIYPGSITISGGVVTDWGTPVAEGGVSSSTMTIEMGSLYAASDTKHSSPPPTSGELFRFTVDVGTTVSITENAIRGKVVKENRGNYAALTTECAITAGGCATCPGDLDNDEWVTPDDLTAMVIMLQGFSDSEYLCELGTEGCDKWCADMDDDEWATPDDLTALVIALQAYSDSEYLYPCFP